MLTAVLIVQNFIIVIPMCRLISMTSPNLNYVICCGTLMLYIAVYFYAIHSTDPDAATVLCNVSQCESVILYEDVTVVGYVFYLLVVVLLSHVMIIQIRPWLVAIGYSLAFGPVLGKMWRVYYLLTHPTARKWVCIYTYLFRLYA